MDTETTGAGLSPLLDDADTTCRTLGGISRRTLDYMVERGDLPVVKVGRRSMFRRSDVEAYIAARVVVRERDGADS